MTTAHTQHGLIVDNSDGSDRDAPITEPFSSAELAFGVVCVALIVFIVGPIAGYVWRLM